MLLYCGLGTFWLGEHSSSETCKTTWRLFLHLRAQNFGRLGKNMLYIGQRIVLSDNIANLADFLCTNTHNRYTFTNSSFTYECVSQAEPPSCTEPGCEPVVGISSTQPNQRSTTLWCGGAGTVVGTIFLPNEDGPNISTTMLSVLAGELPT